MDSVGENISLKAAFNDLCGFTEADITTLLKSLAGGGAGRIRGGGIGDEAYLL